ncbi:hypothetical protein GCM10010123_36610 [Pilimelia anulata]|uniref:Uncharacterized protein n=1 Tax=Pilimelia anulata TaxID=53371 RepID=A0A8J3FBW1_9ACTN|nr:hypothetical protein GCM10010123_36610 [Pilimelia anulata]
MRTAFAVTRTSFHQGIPRGAGDGGVGDPPCVATLGPGPEFIHSHRSTQVMGAHPAGGGRPDFPPAVRWYARIVARQAGGGGPTGGNVHCIRVHMPADVRNRPVGMIVSQ